MIDIPRLSSGIEETFNAISQRLEGYYKEKDEGREKYYKEKWARREKEEKLHIRLQAFEQKYEQEKRQEIKDRVDATMESFEDSYRDTKINEIINQVNNELEKEKYYDQIKAKKQKEMLKKMDAEIQESAAQLKEEKEEAMKKKVEAESSELEKVLRLKREREIMERLQADSQIIIQLMKKEQDQEIKERTAAYERRQELEMLETNLERHKNADKEYHKSAALISILKTECDYMERKRPTKKVTFNIPEQWVDFENFDQNTGADYLSSDDEGQLADSEDREKEQYERGKNIEPDFSRGIIVAEDEEFFSCTCPLLESDDDPMELFGGRNNNVDMDDDFH